MSHSIHVTEAVNSYNKSCTCTVYSRTKYVNLEILQSLTVLLSYRSLGYSVLFARMSA